MFVTEHHPYKQREHDAARELRKEGMSFKKIAAELNVSVASAHRWTNDIELTQEQIDFNLGRGLTADSEVVNRRAKSWSTKNRSRREGFQDEGRAVARLNDPIHRGGCMLFWAEGSRRNQLTFSNSDIHMVQAFAEFLRSSFGVSGEDFTFSVNVYLGNGLTLEEIEDHWLDALHLERNCLRCPQINHMPTSCRRRLNTDPLSPV